MIRFALLGAGRIGQMHAANIAGHERCKLSWIYENTYKCLITFLF